MQLSLLICKGLIMSLLLTGGLSMCPKKERIISSIRKWQTRYLKKSHKFGIELPKTVEQTLALDAKNGNTLWADAYPKKLRMSEWHLMYYQTGSQYP